MATTQADDSGSSSTRSPRPATIYDVARLAGVSHQTVSRLLKGEGGIKPANRERVMAALDALNYRPNLTARSLATSRSNRIAVLTHEIAQVGPGRIVQGASAEARAHGFLLDIITLDVSDRAAIDVVIDEINHQEVAGILALASTDEMIDAFEHSDFRVPALLGSEVDDRSSPRSQVNDEAVPSLVRHVVELGHRRVLHIAGPEAWVAARNRSRAVERSLAACDIESVHVRQGDWSAASGYRAIRETHGSGFTAVIASNDQMAIGAILALVESGLRVPQDVSVTGMDDIPEAAFISPPLTTLRIDFDRQGREAFHRLRTLIEGGTPSPAGQSASLVVRRSTSVTA